MPASRVHLVRHGEVANPDGILYARLPGYRLSERGELMAAAAAQHLLDRGAPVTKVASSPLERTMESALPIATAFGLEIEPRDGLIEASSRLEGGRYDVSLKILRVPAAWRYLVNPLRPSWGEPFREVAARMSAELAWARDSVEEGDVVLVSHQLPIWMVARLATGRPLVHDPRRRRCSLSSITTMGWRGDQITELSYAEPALEVM